MVAIARCLNKSVASLYASLILHRMIVQMKKSVLFRNPDMAEKLVPWL